jgi:hypothetical protein
MSRSIFNPTGTLNVSWDASDLPGEGAEGVEVSGAMTRCKNLRVNQNGKLVTRDGSTKINGSAIATDVWHIEEMATLGTRYTFAGTVIYEDEVSLATGLTSAAWSAIQYNAFNDTTKQIFALNGTDRKRITAGAVSEWGIAAPTTAPSLGVGHGTGLTGQYNAKYTYVRKVGDNIVAESNPSPAASTAQVLSNGSLEVTVTEPTDTQVTHIRLYRTQAGGSIYYLDQEIATSNTYAYGNTQTWEETDAYIAGNAYKFTTTDSTHYTENTYTWEELFADRDDEDTTTYGSETTPWADLDDWTAGSDPDGNRYYLP